MRRIKKCFVFNVKQTPSDSIVLTLACGKFRFNNLDLEEIGGLPVQWSPVCVQWLQWFFLL